MGFSKVGGGVTGFGTQWLYRGMGAFRERMVIEAAHGTCVLEAGEGHLRLGRLRLCARPAPFAAA